MCAVSDLQYQCYVVLQEKGERSGKEKHQPQWTFQVSRMGVPFYGQGKTRGAAEKDAMDQCKERDAFFCRVEKCSNE
ncbi:MAG: hypothetical protein WCI27_05020 [Candidatus Omnitrophota bacterium]